jgi:hypothetical protein
MPDDSADRRRDESYGTDSRGDGARDRLASGNDGERASAAVATAGGAGGASSASTGESSGTDPEEVTAGD